MDKISFLKNQDIYSKLSPAAIEKLKKISETKFNKALDNIIKVVEKGKYENL